MYNIVLDKLDSSYLCRLRYCLKNLPVVGVDVDDGGDVVVVVDDDGANDVIVAVVWKAALEALDWASYADEAEASTVVVVVEAVKAAVASHKRMEAAEVSLLVGVESGAALVGAMFAVAASSPSL